MSSSQPQPSMNSRWIWPFEILEQIGEGGMGVVYRARYVVNGREVALKMVPAELADKTALARFERELEVLKTLRHPNIVRCFGGVCEDKRRFYAMELIQGGTLEDQLQARGRLPWEQVVQYGLQMCEALKCSHDKGVIHRDVKPSNFLLTPSGQLKLSDFGLASVMSAHKITAAGKTAGTFLYMAPEQIRGHDVIPQTDLYALGCVLFELVTGEVPFIGETAGATLHLHCFSPPPRPTEKALDCPVALEKIILKLLEKDPAKRFESAAVLAKELAAIDQSSTITVLNERGRNFPTNLQDRAAPPTATDTQKSTTELGRVVDLIAVRKQTLLLSGVLFVSLIGNGFQFLFSGHDRPWREMWMHALHDSDDTIKLAALKTVGEVSRHDPRHLRILTSYLESPQPVLRVGAVNGLGEAHGAASSELPRLIKLQKSDPDEQVRVASGFAIEKIRNSQTGFRFPWHLLGAVILTIAALGGAYYFWTRMKELREE